MSPFVRPESPPPRQPSPDITYTPLNPPRARRPLLSMQSTSSAPTIGSLRPKALHSARSCDQLRDREHTKRKRDSTRSKASSNGPSTPRSLQIQLPTSTSPSPSSKRRSLSFAIPYRSPPASPTLSSPPPPVPPIPAFALDPAYKKPVLHPLPSNNSYTLPDLDSISPISTSMFELPRRYRKTGPAVPDGRDLVAMTCSKFFSLHNSNHRAAQACAV